MNFKKGIPLITQIAEVLTHSGDLIDGSSGVLQALCDFGSDPE